MHWIGLQSFITDLFEALNYQVFERIAIDQSFRDGFLWAMGLAFVLGLIGRMGIYAWGKVTSPIRVFFAATRLPASNPGPSPASKFSGCMGSVLIITLIIVGIIWILASNIQQSLAGS